MGIRGKFNYLGSQNYWEKRKEEYIAKHEGTEYGMTKSHYAYLRILDKEIEKIDLLQSCIESLSKLCAREALQEESIDTQFVALSLINLCKASDIKVVFSGYPKETLDKRTIRLGAVDVGNPIAPIYIWGVGLHERNHILFTDFSALESATNPLIKDLVTVLEDARVDLIAWSELRGFPLWKKALIDVYFKTKHGFFQNAKKSDTSEIKLSRYLWYLINTAHFGFDIPSRWVHSNLEAARKIFGDYLLDEVRNLIQKKFPTKSTEENVELAHEIFSLFKTRLKALETRNESLKQEQEIAKTERNISLKEEETNLRDALSDFIFGSKSNKDMSVSYLDNEAKKNLFEVVSAAKYEVEDKTDEEAFAEIVRSSCCGYEENEQQKAIEAVESLGFKGCSLEKDKEQQKRRKEFLDFLKSIQHINFNFFECLKRPFFTGYVTTSDGWDVDEDKIDSLLVGDDKVFKRDAPEDNRKLACQILIDRSGSVGQLDFMRFRAVALRLEEAMKATPNIKAQTAIFPGITGKTIDLVSRFDTSPKLLLHNLAGMYSSGPTLISESLMLCAQKLIVEQSQSKLIVVITDGDFSANDYVNVRNKLSCLGIEVLVICYEHLYEPNPQYEASRLTKDRVEFGDTFNRVFRSEDIPRVVSQALSRYRREAWKRALRS